MIDSIKVRNFRSLKDTNVDGKEQHIQLKPFTILLGKNSSGKSSFLRLFPLFKQSVTGRTRGALAFYGDEVDFGDFNTVVSKNNLTEEVSTNIDFEFEGKINTDQFRNRYIYDGNKTKAKDLEYNVRIKIENNEEGNFPFIETFSLELLDFEIKFSINKENKLKEFYINGTDFSTNLINCELFYTSQKPCFPTFMVPDNDFIYDSFWKPFLEIIDERKSFEREYFKLIRILSFFELNTKTETYNFFTNKEGEWKKYLDNKTLSEKIIKKINESDDFNFIYETLVFARFEEIYNIVVSDILDTFHSTFYSKPLRANADRYYRNRTLLVSEINSDGSNLVEYYNNLGKKKQEDLKKWLFNNFKFFYTVEKKEGLQSIFIYESESVKHNITDMGFGFSQILPIVTQLWALKNSQQRHRRYIYVIEQPELHLHPGLQSKLIHALGAVYAVAKLSELNISFIIETHSETIINQFGKLAEKKRIDPDDIQVLIFEKDKSTGFSNISKSIFSEDGELNNWPIDFFGDDE